MDARLPTLPNARTLAMATLRHLLRRRHRPRIIERLQHAHHSGARKARLRVGRFRFGDNPLLASPIEGNFLLFLGRRLRRGFPLGILARKCERPRCFARRIFYKIGIAQHGRTDFLNGDLIFGAEVVPRRNFIVFQPPHRVSAKRVSTDVTRGIVKVIVAQGNMPGRPA